MNVAYGKYSLGPITSSSTSIQTIGTFALSQLQTVEEIFFDAKVFVAAPTADAEGVATRATVYRVANTLLYTGGVFKFSPSLTVTTIHSGGSASYALNPSTPVTFDFASGALRLRCTPNTASTMQIVAAAETIRIFQM